MGIVCVGVGGAGVCGGVGVGVGAGVDGFD